MQLRFFPQHINSSLLCFSWLEYASVAGFPIYQCHIHEIEIFRILACGTGINIYNKGDYQTDYKFILRVENE